jgi:RHS repeat-associated protein
MDPGEGCASGCQRSGGDKPQLKAGDPVNTGNGAYQFTLPLLNLGGPMDLHFDLIYGSDLSNNWIGDDDFPNAGGRGAGYFRFWWSPKCSAGLWGLNQFWLEDFRSVAIDGETGEIPEWSEAQPVRYQMRETTGYVYLMDPIRERVYIFEKGSDRIRYILDRNGNALTYTYDGGDNLTQIADGLGRTLTFTHTTYSGDTVLTQVADQASRSISLNYEENAADNDNKLSLRSVTDPLGHTTTFSYTAVDGTVDNVTTVRRPLGNTPYTQSYARIVMSGTIATRVTTQTDAYDNAVSFTYDHDQNQVTTDWADGSTVVYQHYGHHEPPKGLTDAVSNTIGFARNDRDQVTAVTDRMGDATSLTYHAESGKMASITNTKGDTITNHYITQTQTFTNPAIAETVVFTFYNLTQVDYPDSTHEAFAYDGHGNVITYTDQVGQEWGYQYNDRGKVTKATNPSGGMVDYTYNADGTLATSTDSDTDFTTYGYDGYKRPVTITHTGGIFHIAYNLNDQVKTITDERSNTYTYEYDANGNLVKITDPATNQIQYTYNNMDRVVSVTDRRGKAITMSYDVMNRPASVTDANGNKTQFGHDPRGWANQLVDPAGKVWQMGYDDEGVMTSLTTPLGFTVSLGRDKLGHLSGVTDTLGHSTDVTRDALGRITAVSDPVGRQTSYDYDDLGSLTAVTAPVIGAATYDYNALGLLSAIHDLKGQTWSIGYTAMGRLSSVTDPVNNQWQYTYDQRGLLNQVTYPDSVTQTLTYDAAGNLTRRQYTDGPILSFTYDALDWITAANDIGFEYNKEGQVTGTWDDGVTFEAAYDDGGRLETATYAGGLFTVTYQYNTRDMPTQISDSLTGATIQFTYNDDGRLTDITRSNGVNAAFTWDDASRLTRLQEGTLADMQYTYNGAGDVTQATLDLPLNPADTLVGQVDNFSYDNASQVNTTGYTYDARGRQTASPGHTYTWDGASRLTGIDDVTLTYNGLGDLRTRAEGGNAIHFYYNYALGLHPIVAERDETGDQFLRYYVWTPGGELLYMIDAANGNAVYFYHFDKNGNTLFLTDVSGTVTDKYAYAPYGTLLGHEGASDQPFTFLGERGVRQEGASGTLYHVRLRYYDALTARFLSRDPIWIVISSPRRVNPYQYAQNDPLGLIDVTGASGFGVFGETALSIPGNMEYTPIDVEGAGLSPESTR